MNTASLHRSRLIFGWITSALLVIALLCLADGLAAGFKGEQRDLQALPGAELPFTSPLPAGAASLDEMRVQGGDQWVSLTPESVFSGFWLGGTMWRGTIRVAADAPPGARAFTLIGTGPVDESRPARPLTVSVAVHADAASLQAASPSLLTRWFGVRPFAVSALFFCIALPFGLAVFLASRSIERTMEENGRASVYMAKRTDEGMLIAFSLGRNRGIEIGSRVRLFDTKGAQVGMAEVNSCDATDATARLVEGACTVGFIAVVPGAKSPHNESR